MRHYVFLAGLWVDVSDATVTLAERKGYIMIAGGNLGIAARVLREVPSRWLCWDDAACEPRPPMRPVTFSLEADLLSEGEEISAELLELSRQADPDLDAFHAVMNRAFAWDVRVRDALTRIA